MEGTMKNLFYFEMKNKDGEFEPLGVMTLHDALEAVYHPHVDFDGVGALAEDHIRWLLEAT